MIPPHFTVSAAATGVAVPHTLLHNQTPYCCLTLLLNLTAQPLPLWHNLSPYCTRHNHSPYGTITLTAPLTLLHTAQPFTLLHTTIRLYSQPFTLLHTTIRLYSPPFTLLHTTIQLTAQLLHNHSPYYHKYTSSLPPTPHPPPLSRGDLNFLRARCPTEKRYEVSAR